jgi:hypothetical protein
MVGLGQFTGEKQSKPGSLCIGREKRFEQLALMLGRYACTVVLNLEQYLIALLMQPDLYAAGVLAANTPGIAQQVPQDLAQMVGVELEMQVLVQADTDSVGRYVFGLTQLGDQQGQR